MESKEEILVKILPHDIWESVDENLCNCPPRYIYQAMDEYARQMVVEFAEWVTQTTWGYIRGMGWVQSGIPVKSPISTEELYQIFLTEKSE